ncbi:MAG: hypothetical protein ACSLE0_23270 [Chitinophagaceae bacterium]
MNRKGIKPAAIELDDNLEYLPAKEAAKIKRGLKKQIKKGNKKHIYFNEEWDNKN